jgi:hypothetical protein
MDSNQSRPSISSALNYKDPKRALRWLEEAFGFEPFMVILGPNDELMHSEMRFGDGVIMVGSEWSPAHRSPANLDGLNTQTVHVQLKRTWMRTANALEKPAPGLRWSPRPSSTAIVHIAQSIPRGTSGASVRPCNP